MNVGAAATDDPAGRVFGPTKPLKNRAAPQGLRPLYTTMARIGGSRDSLVGLRLSGMLS